MTPNETQVYGSSQSADVVVVGEGVAARHCQVVFEVDGYWIEDLLSKSGTFVNGDSVTNRMLREGDLVHLGAAALVFSNGMLVRKTQADVEQPLRISDVPTLPGATYELPDDLPAVVTPRSTGRARPAGSVPKPLRVVLISIIAVIGGIALLVATGSNNSGQPYSGGDTESVAASSGSPQDAQKGLSASADVPTLSTPATTAPRTPQLPWLAPQSACRSAVAQRLSTSRARNAARGAPFSLQFWQDGHTRRGLWAPCSAP